jgi:outer membrane murein-binding lipoprotein Lpp
MGTRRLIVCALLLAAPLLAGCGGSGSANRAAMDVKFQKIDAEMANYETLNSQYNESHFEQATRNYIALVRKYADTLGPAEARQRLRDKGDELSAYCLPCTAILDDEAQKY